MKEQTVDKQIEHNEARRLERQPESASSLRILTSPTRKQKAVV